MHVIGQLSTKCRPYVTYILKGGMDREDRLNSLKRLAFVENYHVNGLLLSGDYPSLQEVINCEKYQIDGEQLELVRIGKNVYRVQEILTSPEWFDFIVCEKIYHVSEPPPPLEFKKNGDITFPEWPGYLIQERNWTIAN